MIKLFARYTSVGVINTIIHWIIFYVLFCILETNQSIANFSGFVISVTFSFLVNARFTFKSTASALKYMLYFSFMGLLSLTVGGLSDWLHMPSMVTLVTFSLISLVCGFIYSKYIVFKNIK